MLTHRQTARDYLENTSDSNFWNIVKASKIKEPDIPILDAKFLKGKSNEQISRMVNCSVDTVNKKIARCYDKISKLISLIL